MGQNPRVKLLFLTHENLLDKTNCHDILELGVLPRQIRRGRNENICRKKCILRPDVSVKSDRGIPATHKHIYQAKKRRWNVSQHRKKTQICMKKRKDSYVLREQHQISQANTRQRRRKTRAYAESGLICQQWRQKRELTRSLSITLSFSPVSVNALCYHFSLSHDEG